MSETSSRRVHVAKEGLSGRILFLSFFAGALALAYWAYKDNFLSLSYRTKGIEEIVAHSWDKLIKNPDKKFERVVIGINCCVDLVVSAMRVLKTLDVVPSSALSATDHGKIATVEELSESFSFFFTKGAPAERFISDEKLFLDTIAAADRNDPEYTVGGNAANIAQNLAQQLKTILLIGSIGPRLTKLLHNGIKIPTSTELKHDEIHIVLEYAKGEPWGDMAAPNNGRYITSHDVARQVPNNNTAVIDEFFQVIHSAHPDLVVFTGIHLLEFLPKDWWETKMRLIEEELMQLNRLIPIHFEIGSMADREHGERVLEKIVPHIDSLGLNDQELAYISYVGKGPYSEEYGSPESDMNLNFHVYKTVELIYWLLNDLFKDYPLLELTRIHVHTLTYHVIAVKGADWLNSEAALAAGAKLAVSQACDFSAGVDISEHMMGETTVLKTNKTLLLDRRHNKEYRFDPYDPVIEGKVEGYVFITHRF